MEIDLKCTNCGADLEDWNTGNNAMRYCPCCGKELPREQNDELWRKCTNEEIADIISDHVLDVLEEYDDLDVGDMGFKAWERENIDGVAFYSNYTANQFTMRHSAWVDEALETADDQFGEDGHYAKMKAECNDKFLVVAFILATEHYLYSQLGLDNDERKLTPERKEEIKKLMEETVYDGSF